MNIRYQLLEIDAVAQQIVEHCTHDCILLEAPMGAGKTTLIKSMCKQLGILDQVSSPTFSLVNEYQGNDITVLHFDLYRIEKATELHEIGMEDYLDRKAIKFIEWPELAMPLLEKYHTITIKIIDEDQRELTFI